MILCLASLDQPFALGFLGKGLHSYRKQCMEHHYFVGEGAKEEELGPPGRVFQSGCWESSPDLRLYSIKELRLRDHAAHCGLRRYLALPVFDTSQTRCGILELVEYGYYKGNGWLDITRALKEANLRIPHFGMLSSIEEIRYLGREINDEGRRKALSEIRQMLNLAVKTTYLSLAQVLVPCIKCANKSNGGRCMNREMIIHEKFHLGRAEFLEVHYSYPVQIGKGVAGMALGSENRSCFCQNLCDFSIAEQPMVHYAQSSRLDICFAICLQSSYSGDKLYVLEFFLNSGIRIGGYPQSLYSLLLLMKQKLKSFKVASGQPLGDQLVVDVIETCKENKLYESTYPDIPPLRFNIIQYSQETEHKYSRNKQVHGDHNGMNSGTNIAETEQRDVAAGNVNKGVTTEKTHRGSKYTSFHINHGDVEPHLGKRLQDITRGTGVGKSTVKRVRHDDGFDSWPGNEQNKRNPSVFVTKTAVKQYQDGDVETSVRDTIIPPLDTDVHKKKPLTNTESTLQPDKMCPKADAIMVKAKFKNDTMKFQLCISSGIEKLMEEVGKRLKLKIENFKLKYLDEGDDEWILLGCEDALQLCVKISTALGKTGIQVLVESTGP